MRVWYVYVSIESRLSRPIYVGETHGQWDGDLAREGEGREGWGGGDDDMAGAGNNEVDARTMAIRSGVCDENDG
jgi:hypothetical protein